MTIFHSSLLAITALAGVGCSKPVDSQRDQEIDQLEERINQLEIENADLREQSVVSEDTAPVSIFPQSTEIDHDAIKLGEMTRDIERLESQQRQSEMRRLFEESERDRHERTQQLEDLARDRQDRWGGFQIDGATSPMTNATLVIASVAKQSSVARHHTGLPRFARNDGWGENSA